MFNVVELLRFKVVKVVGLMDANDVGFNVDVNAVGFKVFSSSSPIVGCNVFDVVVGLNVLDNVGLKVLVVIVGGAFGFFDTTSFVGSSVG